MKKLFRTILVVLLTATFLYLGVTFIFTPVNIEDKIALTAIRCVGVAWFLGGVWVVFNLKKIVQEL